MGATKKFESAKFLNHKVQVRCDVDRHIVRIICSKQEIASRYLARLIVEKKIGSVDTVIYSAAKNSRVVALLRGESLNRFLRAGQKHPLPKPKKKFSELADGSA